MECFHPEETCGTVQDWGRTQVIRMFWPFFLLLVLLKVFEELMKLWILYFVALVLFPLLLSEREWWWKRKMCQGKVVMPGWSFPKTLFQHIISSITTFTSLRIRALIDRLPLRNSSHWCVQHHACIFHQCSYIFWRGYHHKAFFKKKCGISLALETPNPKNKEAHQTASRLWITSRNLRWRISTD